MIIADFPSLTLGVLFQLCTSPLLGVLFRVVYYCSRDYISGGRFSGETTADNAAVGGRAKRGAGGDPDLSGILQAHQAKDRPADRDFDSGRVLLRSGVRLQLCHVPTCACGHGLDGGGLRDAESVVRAGCRCPDEPDANATDSGGNHSVPACLPVWLGDLAVRRDRVVDLLRHGGSGNWFFNVGRVSARIYAAQT